MIMVEHGSILKNNQNTYYRRFSITPKTGIAFPKMDVLFYLCGYDCFKGKRSGFEFCFFNFLNS